VEGFMQLLAASVYWVIVALWATVLGTIAVFYLRNPHAFGTARLLLSVLAIDTVRNLVENVYFGVYFGSLYGLFPSALGPILGAPHLIIIPKLLNIVAGTVVLGLLLLRWLPAFSHDVAILQDFADTDPLTRLLNRRSFLFFAKDTMEHFRRYGRSFGILMIDIDHFKVVNDVHGHAAGDVVIQRIASVINLAVRPTDKVARFGGEEFVVLLREVSAEEMMVVAERIRAAVGSAPIRTSDLDLVVTVSVGCTTAGYADAKVEDAIERADRALYAAKAKGRNRVALSAPEPILVAA
jgi:diguanylate cyclase (GGDEF)-like protein